MTIRVVGQRLICDLCNVTRCLEGSQDPHAFDRLQQHYFTLLEAFTLEHLHGAPRPSRLTRPAVRPNPRVTIITIEPWRGTGS
ncbi:MAG TPA: hypothetical protein VK550_00930 [Polyangiaceae bacterium]|nr:hypothetical protein [Polyangiaceae bacterium]